MKAQRLIRNGRAPRRYRRARRTSISKAKTRKPNASDSAKRSRSWTSIFATLNLALAEADVAIAREEVVAAAVVEEVGDVEEIVATSADVAEEGVVGRVSEAVAAAGVVAAAAAGTLTSTSPTKAPSQALEAREQPTPASARFRHHLLGYLSLGRPKSANCVCIRSRLGELNVRISALQCFLPQTHRHQ